MRLNRSFVICTALGAVGLAIAVPIGTRRMHPETERAIRDVQAGALPTVQRGIRVLLQQRTTLIERLVALCGPEHGEATRAAAMYTLGKMRAVEACPTLLKYMGFEPAPVPGTRKPPEAAVLYGACPAELALIAIGKPSVPLLLGEIQRNPKMHVRHQCRSAIKRIEGFRHTHDLLEEALQGQTDPAARQRLAGELEIIDRQIKAREAMRRRKGAAPEK